QRGLCGISGVSADVIDLTKGGLAMMRVTRIQFTATAVAMLGLAIAGATALATQAAGIVCAGQFPSPSFAIETPVTRDDRTAESGMTLEQAIKSYLRATAGERAKYQVSESDAQRLTSLFVSNRQQSPTEATRPRTLGEAVFQNAVRNQIDAL